MIGIETNGSSSLSVEEFFQLFKTPWKWLDGAGGCDVVMTTAGDIPAGCDAPFYIVIGSEEKEFDTRHGLAAERRPDGSRLLHEDAEIPIYGGLAVFDTEEPGVVLEESSRRKGAVDLSIDDGKRVLRLGYDLFEEVEFLLTRGQPVENALIPAVERHIQVVRQWLAGHGIPFVEVLPRPEGFDFVACLTHDVDFVRIRDHFLDVSSVGFAYRASVGSLIRFAKGRMPLGNVLKNLAALARLPFVYLGLCRDFWLKFDDYVDLEEEIKSTFFIIPFSARKAHCRSILQTYRPKYDIDDIDDILRSLISRGKEIGLHGIDAWRDETAAGRERDRIASVAGTNELGIRMHWLRFDQSTPAVLSRAGFVYDSTVGYNETVGYRSGTAQAYCPPRPEAVLEIPMHLQDTALFFPGRMNLSEEEAWVLVERLLGTNREFGGALTVNWHMRSVAPERLWTDFYSRLVAELRTRKAWFATAMEAARWFSGRRSLVIDESGDQPKGRRIVFKNLNAETTPAYVLRMYNCVERGSQVERKRTEAGYEDLPLRDEGAVELEIFSNGGAFCCS